MKPIMRWLALAYILAALGRAADTFAYHFADAPRTENPITECPQGIAVPAPTPFVAAGDNAYDLTELTRAHKLPLVDGWVLWNQTQRLLVIHAALIDQWRISEQLGFDRQDRNVRVSVNWIRGEPTVTPPGQPEPVFATVNVLGTPGKVSKSSCKVVEPSGSYSVARNARRRT